MFFGPPAIRLATETDSRTGLSSLEGDQDIWNYIRLAWWAFWGLAALWSVWRNRRAAGQMLSRTGHLYLWVALYLGGLAVSAVFSPVPLFTAANVGLMALVAAAGLDAAVRLYTGRLAVRELLHGLLVTAVLLLSVISVLYALTPDLQYRGWFGLRLRGESFGYTPLLSIVTIVLSLHFLLLTPGARRFRYALLLIFGIVWLVLGQTRSAYLGLGFGMAVFVWHATGLGRNSLRLTLAAMVGLLALTNLGLLYGNSDTAGYYVDRVFERFVVRDYWALKDDAVRARSFSTLNGRTEAAAILLEGVAESPLGLGYIGGVRTHMSKPENMDRLPSEAFIGAHNGYLEVLGGGGFLAFLGYLLVLFWGVVHVRRHHNVEALVSRVLLYVLLIEAFFESEIAYPFHQSPVLLWILLAIIAAGTARTAASRPPVASPIRKRPSHALPAPV